MSDQFTLREILRWASLFGADMISHSDLVAAMPPGARANFDARFPSAILDCARQVSHDHPTWTPRKAGVEAATRAVAALLEEMKR